MAFESSGANYTLGKGRGYFDRKRGDAFEGERELGNIVSMSVSVEMDRRNHQNTKGDYRFTDKSVILSVNPKISVTLDEINAENLGLLFLADVRDASQDASASEQTMTIGAARVAPGRVIDLGLRFIDPDSFALAGPGGAAYAPGADYRLDATSGKLHILGGGAITGAEDLSVAYSLAARRWRELRNYTRPRVEGRFTYVSDNSNGGNFIVEYPHVLFTLSGEAALITDREDTLRIGLEGEILADREGHPDSPFGRTIVFD